uniref:Uncharacterized protein n=1 Tax=Anopheles marajoara TaxID=58244 RepID=A0A2M4C4F7_9DIPT
MVSSVPPPTAVPWLLSLFGLLQKSSFNRRFLVAAPVNASGGSLKPPICIPPTASPIPTGPPFRAPVVVVAAVSISQNPSIPVPREEASRPKPFAAIPFIIVPPAEGLCCCCFCCCCSSICWCCW